MQLKGEKLKMSTRKRKGNNQFYSAPSTWLSPEIFTAHSMALLPHSDLSRLPSLQQACSLFLGISHPYRGNILISQFSKLARSPKPLYLSLPKSDRLALGKSWVKKLFKFL